MKYLVILPLFVTLSFAFHAYQRTPLGDSVVKASMKMLKETFQNAKDKNVIVSPLGVLTLLSMYSAGTEGKTREEIMQLLGSIDYKQIQDSYGSLVERFSSINSSYFVLANKMCITDKYTLDDQFSDVASRTYKSEVEQIDFSKKNTTADSINKWADEKTKGHIKSPVNDKTIDESTILALFNVIFFQGHWNLPFDASETEEKDFYSYDFGTVKKPMMMLYDRLFYREDPEIGARMVELPYKENGFRMVIVLPDKTYGLAQVLEKLAQKGLLEDVFALWPSRQEVVFEMPKFEIRNSLDLKDILRKVGVSRIFSDGARGVVRDQSVVVSKAFQEAFIKVDEEGATAGAFTGFTIELRSNFEEPRPLEFKVDHPFMFTIMHEDVILFTGTYTH